MTTQPRDKTLGPQPIDLETIRIKPIEERELEEIYSVQLDIFGEDALLEEWVLGLPYHALVFWKMVCKENDDLIGVIAVTRGRYHNLILYVLFIMPKFQHQGYGTYLLKKVIIHLKDLGYNEITLNTKDNNHAAINFYKKLGFKVVDHVKRYYRSGDNSYVMALYLN